MRHFALTVAYDGTSYGGWQIQANSVAVQQILMEAIAKGTGEHVHAQGSGRTDAGVHATGQVASISLQNWNPWCQPSIAIFQSRLSFEGAGKLISDSIQFEPLRANAIDIAFATHAFPIRFTIHFIGFILDRSTSH